MTTNMSSHEEIHDFISPAKHSGHNTVLSSAPPKIQSGTTKLLQQLLRSGQKGLQIYKLEPTMSAPRAKKGDLFSTPSKQDQKTHASAAKSANKMPMSQMVDAENMHPNTTPTMSRENSKETGGENRDPGDELPLRNLFKREASNNLQVAAELVYETPEKAAKAAGTPNEPLREPENDGPSSFDTGIFWKVKNNKYIACSFGPDSVAKRVGVRPGDILRSVDGVDILGFQMDDSGHHPADDLLLGKKESLCALKFLRVAQPDPKTIKPEGTRLVEFSVTLKRTSFVEEEQEEEKENKVNMVFSPIVK